MSYEETPVPEITARQKFSCPACGAEATWNPAKQMLVCEFCGTTSPAQLTTEGEIKEHDLATALRGMGDEQRGWAVEKRSVKCQSCQAISVLDPAKVGQRCEFCGSSQLVDYAEVKAPIRPESVLPFQLSQAQVRERMRQWYGSHWLAPNKLKRMAMTDTLHGIYVPYWTFDAHVEADWTADAGYYYYETESYTDSNGNRQTRQVRKVRWVPSSGHISHFFDDELIPASKGLSQKYIRGIEPFPTTEELVPYDAGYVSGWTVEHYQLDLLEAARAAQARMEAATQQLCSQDVPGDTQRNLQTYPEFSAQTFKHILLPVWVLSYNYGSRRFQVLINGYTGKTEGGYPYSWVKITLLVLAAFILILIFLHFYGQGS